MAMIDTAEAVQELKEAGLPEEQARGIVRIIVRTIDARNSDLATKADLAATEANLEKSIAAMRADVEKSIAALRGEVDAKLSETKADILKWMFGAIGFQTLVIVGAILAITRG